MSERTNSLNYEAEYEVLKEKNMVLSMDLEESRNAVENLQIQNSILKAQLDIVRLIFGGDTR
jgi:FtsZ-binding cell division protein ZapB